MYELSRVRLHSVGPPAARYANVILDFRGVGPLVPARAQGALFPGGDGGPARRPSPASVLFLENGGGKSVLIKLIFSVMLAGRRQVVGTTNTRVLEKFVLGNEVAHIALEWLHTRTGDLRVTGKVSEWRGHTISSDPGNLLDRWYSFRPTSKLNLDSLPVTENGRLLTLAGFHDRLREAHEFEPELQLGWERIHADWTTHLADIGLDTELFRYQRAMNAGEGEAADVFSFKSDEAFVDFLLRAVTDEEDPRGLADVVDRYAHKLANRDTLMAERDFVAGALEWLEPLAAAEELAATAREVAHDTRTAATGFLSAVARRHEAEAVRLESLHESLGEAVQLEQATDQEQRRLNAVVLELRRLLTELQLREAEDVAEDVGRRLEDARMDHEAWRATETVLQYRGATRKAQSLRELVSNREDRARPALLARNAATQALGRALRATLDEAETTATAAETEANALAEQAVAADAKRYEAVVESSKHTERAKRAQQELDAIRQSVDAATAEGWLSADADVAAEADFAQAVAAEAQEQSEQALEKLTQLADDLSEAERAMERAKDAHGRTEQAADDAKQKADTALTTQAELVRTDRLLELLGAESIELDPDTPTLCELLEEAITQAKHQLTELSMADRRDHTALDALGSGGLLPDPADIGNAVSALTDAQIPAWSGWRYLSRKRPDEQDAVLQRYPHLVDGVVINNPDHLGHAREVLARAQLMPTSVIAVGTTAAMDADAAQAAGLEFVVAPNPAMYDEDAAESERQEIQRRVEQRSDELKATNTQQAVDEELLRRLASWHARYPPGTVADLRAARDNTAAALAKAGTVLADAKTRRAAAASAELEHRNALPLLRRKEEEARKHGEKLATLARQVAQSEGWTADRRDALSAAKTADRQANDAYTHAIALGKKAAELRRTADGHRRTVADCRNELGELRGAGAVDEFAPVPVESVQELRTAHRQAEEAYAKVEVDNDLRAGLEQAEQDESRARAAIDRLDEGVRKRAAELVTTPDGANAASRDAATDRAARAITAIEDRLRDADQRVGGLKTELDKLVKQDRSIEDYGHPRSIEHGEQLIQRAERDWVTARSQHSEAEDELLAVQERKSELDKTIESYKLVMEPIGDIEAGPAELYPVPFDGDVEQAKTRRDQVRSDLTEAQKLLNDEETKVRTIADDLAVYASAERFELAKSPVRRQIVVTPRDTLPRYATEWERALRPRLRTLTDELEQLDRHRIGIIERLKGMVERALGTLRSAQRLSRLPDGLGDWSGQEFLRVKFTPLDEAQLVPRIGEVIDESVVTISKNGSPIRRDGMSLLLRGVRVAAPKGFGVEMLKPDAALRTERLRVSEVKDVFSGGQQLTAAIVLYCTMAALRANERGYARHRHSGVLFLDNPIGRASAGYLLEIQLSVAKALGVQLVYTTGLFDAGALSVFPLLIRLRNDADLREGKKYLSVESTERWKPDQLDNPDGTAKIDATRLFHRPEPAQ